MSSPGHTASHHTADHTADRIERIEHDIADLQMIMTELIENRDKDQRLLRRLVKVVDKNTSAVQHLARLSQATDDDVFEIQMSLAQTPETPIEPIAPIAPIAPTAPTD